LPLRRTRVGIPLNYSTHVDLFRVIALGSGPSP
jgi:hypothetical protein